MTDTRRPEIKVGTHCLFTGRLHTTSDNPGFRCYDNKEVRIVGVLFGHPFPIHLGDEWNDDFGWCSPQDLHTKKDKDLQ